MYIGLTQISDSVEPREIGRKGRRGEKKEGGGEGGRERKGGR